MEVPAPKAFCDHSVRACVNYLSAELDFDRHDAAFRYLTPQRREVWGIPAKVQPGCFVRSRPPSTNSARCEISIGWNGPIPSEGSPVRTMSISSYGGSGQLGRYSVFVPGIPTIQCWHLDRLLIRRNDPNRSRADILAIFTTLGVTVAVAMLKGRRDHPWPARNMHSPLERQFADRGGLVTERCHKGA